MVIELKEESPLKAADKSKSQSRSASRNNKTRDDFLRWLRKKKALQKQAEEEKLEPAEELMVWALMVWDDDGGQPAY